MGSHHSHGDKDDDRAVDRRYVYDATDPRYLPVETTANYHWRTGVEPQQTSRDVNTAYPVNPDIPTNPPAYPPANAQANPANPPDDDPNHPPDQGAPVFHPDADQKVDPFANMRNRANALAEGAARQRQEQIDKDNREHHEHFSLLRGHRDE